MFQPDNTQNEGTRTCQLKNEVAAWLNRGTWKADKAAGKGCEGRLRPAGGASRAWHVGISQRATRKQWALLSTRGRPRSDAADKLVCGLALPCSSPARWTQAAEGVSGAPGTRRKLFPRLLQLPTPPELGCLCPAGLLRTCLREWEPPNTDQHTPY